MRLRGKTAVITGAGSGIGRACVEAFLDEGAAVIAVDRDSQGLLDLAASRTSAAFEVVIGDVRDERVITEAVARASSLGSLNILVNSAGFGIDATVLETSDSQWQDIFDVNVTAIYRWSRAVIPVMAHAGGGSIVNISSNLAEVGTPRRAAYSSTKAAVNGLSRGMAIDHAHQGVRVNVVAPGTTATQYFATMAPEKAIRTDFQEALASRQVLGRIGQPAEIANAVVFLASDESSYATGSVLTVDGGWSIW